jgi:hypothetical protein
MSRVDGLVSRAAECFGYVKSVPRPGCNDTVLKPTTIIAETIVGPTTSHTTIEAYQKSVDDSKIRQTGSL